ncbi:MAG TPA: TonB-dependent receptor, partial [Candidatus Eisenbacteria bacterium]|nr:TonB-dependent receptor [Candidatus Eisenbacteria bacterium]
MSTRLRAGGRGLMALAFAIILGSAGTALAQTPGTGSITGKVTEKGGKEPLGYANVVVLGTKQGAQTAEDGSFTIRNVAPGTYQLRVLGMGYDPVTRSVTVNAGQATQVAVDLGGGAKVVKQVEEIVVTAQKLIDTKTSSTKQLVTSESLKDLPVENLQQAIGLKAGVVATGDDLHFRGGRAGEVKYQLDGVEVSDPLFGRGASVANLAVASADVLSGGFDAEYGNALSGIV